MQRNGGFRLTLGRVISRKGDRTTMKPASTFPIHRSLNFSFEISGIQFRQN